MRNKAYEQWKRRMLLSAKKAKVPVVTHFELTPRCNLDCKMCYIHNADSNALRDRELNTDTWKRIFDEAYDSGMLFANLSGGECMLRSDFKELYLYLWKKRVMVAVLTNGTLIDDDYLDFFKRYPPAEVQVSLYGSNEENYVRVTGHRGFERAMKAIRMLMEAQIPVHVAVTPSKYMKSDFINIRRICKENKFWCNPSEFILGKKRDEIDANDGDLTVDEIVELSIQQAQLDRCLTPVACVPEAGGSCEEAPKGLTCSAGACAVLVSWDGTMQPCTMLQIDGPSLLEQSYSEAWEKIKAATAEMLRGAECVDCAYNKVCPKCPAKRLTGLYTGHCNPAVCEMTRRLVAAGVKKLEQPERGCD